ncbi:ABC transporter substrate-binding protein [Brevibacillus porteri]|uniref:ABC transporter substrate-binding protein n=1 Tax=Brevibacillus porteri TaxID=2126350 RepID=A0ABX5FWC9_9BACL|nr:ABC transporter substrate-binding protein [Brevibacillus porteri]MED1797389.1 ABC transporter substrate-binding protein [Brevibacillus porteri]MED2129459.1 ABC transporter substrate-binding protein [Brevibacillus porteri]MED2747618.1 ABC transporter substrate-binding protein [Brevibacillus porteri]MED2815633.1 ABC transporter substrate-binding protein [Brevibacillus porteri]MED2896746.1 ABC transporter substrate-binding protein [Brevibacillus porteri]
MNKKKRLTINWMILLTVVWVAGCGSPKDQSEQPLIHSTTQSAEQQYPITVSVDGKEVTILKKPQRIAALSLDAAEVVLELVEPERMTVVPKSISNRSLAYRTEEGSKVKNKIAGATSLDPEQILSYEADLLIMTKLHDKEKEANTLLQQSGIPIISLESWSTLDAVMANILTIGKATGETSKAEEIVADMRGRAEKVKKAIEGTNQPSVLVVSPLGPGTGPYLMGSTNISYDLVRLAGAKHAADNLGLSRTTKATIEQIIKADPEYILLVEWQEGKVDDMNDIMQAPGWSTLQAVKNEQVKRMPARKLLNPNGYSIDTLEEIARWLHPDRF